MSEYAFDLINFCHLTLTDYPLYSTQKREISFLKTLKMQEHILKILNWAMYIIEISPNAKKKNQKLYLIVISKETKTQMLFPIV